MLSTSVLVLGLLSFMDFFFVVLNSQIVSSFSWHPKQDSRLLTVTQQGLLRDLIVQEHIPFVSISLKDIIVEELIPF